MFSVHPQMKTLNLWEISAVFLRFCDDNQSCRSYVAFKNSYHVYREIYLYVSVTLAKLAVPFSACPLIAKISSVLLYSEGKDFCEFRIRMLHSRQSISVPGGARGRSCIDGRDESRQIYAVPNVARIPPNSRESVLPYNCTRIKKIQRISLVLIVFFMLNFISIYK